MPVLKWYSIVPLHDQFTKSARNHGAQTSIGRSGMPVATSRLAIASAAFVLLAASSSAALAQKKYDTSATDTEIKMGNTMPYSGPASAYGGTGRTEAAYSKKINAEGGS